MKKNLMSVLILALVVANLILTAILMISVVPQTKKANELITKVCSAIDLDLQSGTGGGNLNLPADQLDDVKIAEGNTMTINLKDSADGSKGHYVVLSVTLSLDKKHDDYPGSSEAVSAKEDMIKDEINNIVSAHTLEEVKDNTQGVKDEILKKIQKMFDSDYIVKVSFPTINWQ